MEEEERRGRGKESKVIRPTILTPELKAKLIKLLEVNFFFRIVAFKRRYNDNEFMNGEGSRRVSVTMSRMREAEVN